MATPSTRPVAIIMGVAGSGKSVVGTAVAARLGLDFVDGDDLHSAANVAKMSAGHPLDDEDRRPWLATIGRWLAERREEGALATCSALKRSYRDQLRAACPGLVFVHLAGERGLIAQRVADRSGHFMPASLIDSQFATLEALADDEPGVTIDVDAPVDDVVATAANWLSRAGAPHR